MERVLVLVLVIAGSCLGQECGSEIVLKPGIAYKVMSKVHNSKCSFEIKRPSSCNRIRMLCWINICRKTNDECSNYFVINEEEQPTFSRKYYKEWFTTSVQISYYISSILSTRYHHYHHHRRRGFQCLFLTDDQSTSTPAATTPAVTTPAAICACGEKTSVGRIVGGFNAIPNSQPWTVYLGIGRFACGGTIISERCVLTAAHCITQASIQNPSLISIYAGAHDVISQPLDENTIIYTPDTVIVHSGYDPKDEQVHNDIALICLNKTSESMTFNENISAICLPKSDAADCNNGSIVTVSGWGTTKYLGDTSDVLKQVDLTIITNEECSKTFNGITSSKLCAFKAGKDACQGDSGGPLSVKLEDQTFLCGIVSTGFECATTFPGIYTRVTSYIDWIQNNSGDGVCIP